MIVTAILPHGKLKSKVLTDGDFSFSLYRGELRKLELEVGGEISEEKLRERLIPLLTARAKARLVYLLKDRDYTERELLGKLREGGCPACAAEAAVSWAKERHYVDDLRYAERFVARRAPEKSRRRILCDLAAKGVAREEAERFLEQNPPDEFGQILRELKKSRYMEHSSDERQRNRILARLARRGYLPEEIFRAIRQLEEQRGEKSSR